LNSLFIKLHKQNTLIFVLQFVTKLLDSPCTFDTILKYFKVRKNINKVLKNLICRFETCNFICYVIGALNLMRIDAHLSRRSLRSETQKLISSSHCNYKDFGTIASSLASSKGGGIVITDADRQTHTRTPSCFIVFRDFNNVQKSHKK
jgi:hypothetical protein